jgi:hypothetical protein
LIAKIKLETNPIEKKNLATKGMEMQVELKKQLGDL